MHVAFLAAQPYQGRTAVSRSMCSGSRSSRPLLMPTTSYLLTPDGGLPSHPSSSSRGRNTCSKCTDACCTYEGCACRRAAQEKAESLKRLQAELASVAKRAQQVQMEKERKARICPSKEKSEASIPVQVLQEAASASRCAHPGLAQRAAALLLCSRGPSPTRT